jgi:hypothetical protein
MTATEHTNISRLKVVACYISTTQNSCSFSKARSLKVLEFSQTRDLILPVLLS